MYNIYWSSGCSHLGGQDLKINNNLNIFISKKSFDDEVLQLKVDYIKYIISFIYAFSWH